MADTPPADIKTAEFPDLAAAASATNNSPANGIDLVKAIQVVLTVELGRTDMVISDILDLTPGKVIELDRLAGEPLDILVNGTLLARGEVVVVDENFGVRLTSIIDPAERAAVIKAEATKTGK